MIREWLREHLPDGARLIDAELVATELVANAIDHGGGAQTVPIVVRPPGRVRVEVEDVNPSVALTVGVSRLGRYRGNGLAIIDAVAAWGVDRTVSGKTVWAEL
ncbi:ATP-binding protein [Pseudonocardia alni]|uniref:ATP-binding protein n=1 Tax=Pseudonocardia alni TaxID=33907 RepID=UPI001AD6E1B4|nr:ATP-binding protein [Pseudonocardia alni]MBO4240830.1 ATP-binding protein [Pseudonocardia alni]